MAQTRQAAAPWPERAWPRSLPEAQGVDSARLVAMLEHVTKHQLRVHSAQIVRNGYLVLDANFYPYPADSLHDFASVTKSITALLIGIALDQQRLASTEQKVLELLPERAVTVDAARKQTITLEHLLTMASGLDCGLRQGEQELMQMMQSPRWPDFALNLPLRDAPGQKFAYCSPNFHLLSAILTKATGKSALAFAQENLFRPLGITQVYWPTDQEGINHGWGDLHLPPLDVARIGYLLLRGGKWKGQQILSTDYLTRATRQQITTPGIDGYGYGWWLSGTVAGVFEGHGRGGQTLIVWPEKDLVVVFTGGGFPISELTDLLRAAVKSNTPLPKNNAAQQQLQAKLAAITKETAPKPPPAVPAPAALIAQISGKTWQFSRSLLAIETMRLRFLPNGDGELLLTRPGQQYTVPIGFAGAYRFSTDNPARMRMGARGEWLSADELRVEFDSVGGINLFTLRLKFSGNQVTVRLSEATGLPGETLTGTGKP